MVRKMTRYFIAIVFLITAFGFVQSAFAQTCTPAPVGLVAWFEGENNALDSRSRNNGTWNGTETYANGKVGQAFKFGPGGGNFVTAPDSPSLNFTTALTVEAWISPGTPNTSVGFTPIVDKGYAASGSSPTFLLNLNPNTLQVQMGIGASTAQDTFAEAPNPLPLNTFTHVVGTYDGATVRIYVNGVLADSEATTISSLAPSGTPLAIGRSVSFSNTFFGVIDEVSLYNRALSASEIAAIYNSQAAGKCKPTATVAPSGQAGWWPGDGDARDISGNANNGTLQNGAAYAVDKVGQGFTFDGVDDYVNVPNSATLDPTTAGSMEAWVKFNQLPSAAGHLMAIIAKGSPGTDFDLMAPTDNRFYFFIGAGPFVISTTVLQTGVWYHVAGTWDATGLRMYVNGTLENTNPASVTRGASGTPLRIGDSPIFGPRLFSGLIDEPAVYNRALSVAEVQSIFNAGVAGKLKPATTPTGSNVSTNVGSDATITFPNVTAAGTTQQIPLDPTVLPALPAGFAHTGLAYDIATAATTSGSVNISFHLPSFNTLPQFSFLKVLHLESGSWVDRTGGVDFASRTLTASVPSLSPFVIAQGSTPTAIKLASFTATGFDDGRVLLEWRTGFEADNLGFNIYREESGKRSLINSSLIAGSALIAGTKTVLSAGESYVWADTLALNPQPRYWLEDVDLNGKSTLYGPIEIRYSKGKSPSLTQSELLTRINWRQSLLTNGLGSTQVQRAASLSNLSPDLLASQYDLASKPAVKLSIKREGWYRVTQPELIRAGIAPSVDPRLLRMFVDGREVPIRVTGEADGRFDQPDAVEFYGLSLDTASTDSHIYWLIASAQTGLRIGLANTTTGKPAPASFACTVERKDRTIYFSSLRNGDAENFFGSVVATQAVDQSLFLQHMFSSPTTSVEIALQGVTLLAHKVKAEINGTSVGTVDFYGQSQGRLTMTLPQAILREGENTVRLTAQGGPGDVSLIDFVRITYQHRFTADANRLRLTASGRQQITINGFTSGDVRIFDVTDPLAALELAGVVRQQKNDYAVTITTPENGERQLLALTANQFGDPASVSANLPSSLRQAANAADLIIITRRAFFSSLERLAALRQSQGLKVTVVDIEDIYDEFSFGHKSPQAVKDFTAYAATNWKKKPRYVLLGGDASYDSKNYLGLGDFDFVPTKLLDTDYMETASDDWFADFNNDGVPELAVGRLPFRNAAEASTMIAKIIGYERSSPSEEVLLVADSNDGFDFEAASAQLAGTIPASLKINQINRGTDTATAKARLLEVINRGQKLVNYTGHGSVSQWRGNLLVNADAAQMKNTDHLSVFVMMTCLNGYFDDPALDSLAESLLKAERGGAVAVWSSSGMTLPGEQAAMNRELYRLIFAASNSKLTIGEVTLRAKSLVADADIRRTWILIGDPAMKLR